MVLPSPKGIFMILRLTPCERYHIPSLDFLLPCRRQVYETTIAVTGLQIFQIFEQIVGITQS